MQAKSILTGAALVLAALFILDVPPANATDYAWTGLDQTNPTYWNDEDNWSDPKSVGGYPDDSNDTATIGDVANDPVVNVSVTVGTVTIQSGGNLTVSNPLTPTTITVSGTLTINNALTVNTMTVNNGATVTGSGLLTVNTLLTMNDDVTIGSFTLGTSADATTNANTLWIAGVLTIKCDGTLTISANGTVHLDGAVTHLIAGTIYLSAATSILHFDDDATLDGYDCRAGEVNGVVVGQNNSAQITIAASKTLTNEITIEGALVIDEPSGSATFINGTGGLVHANRTSDTLALSVAALDDGVNTVPGNWQVSASNAELEFNVGSTCLTGTFTVSNGTLDVNAAICTTGSLSFTGGTIDVAAVTFEAGGSCTCGE